MSKRLPSGSPRYTRTEDYAGPTPTLSHYIMHAKAHRKELAKLEAVKGIFLDAEQYAAYEAVVSAFYEQDAVNIANLHDILDREFFPLGKVAD